MDIAEVVQRSGVPASTLRFYEQKGLIASTGRRGLRRLFDPKVLERLALIKLGRAAGLSLDEVSCMFAPDGRIDRTMLAAKVQELEKTISDLSAMRDRLRHAIACPAPSHMECPNFRRLLHAAMSGTVEAPRKKALLPNGRASGATAQPAVMRRARREPPIRVRPAARLRLIAGSPQTSAVFSSVRLDARMRGCAAHARADQERERSVSVGMLRTSAQRLEAGLSVCVRQTHLEQPAREAERQGREAPLAACPLQRPVRHHYAASA